MNTNHSKIISEFATTALIYCGDYLYEMPTALKVISKCRELGVTILGLDFFRAAQDGIEPTMISANFSELSEHPDSCALSVSAASRVLSTGMPEGSNYVMFTFDD